MSRDKSDQLIEQQIAALRKWQEELGIDLIEIRDPEGKPTYDEKGYRVREYNLSKLHEKVSEIMRRAQANPVYGISPKAAMKRAAQAVAEESKLEAEKAKRKK